VRAFVMICGVVIAELRSYGGLMEGRVALPRVGAVSAGGLESLPWLVLDAAGREFETVSRYLRDLASGDASPARGRSYAHDLLRWFRLLWLVDVGWEQATEAEAAAMVGWLRSAPNPQRKRAGAGVVNARTGKLVIAPSKADRERVIPMSAELFHPVAQVIKRHRSQHGTVPLAHSYDLYERVWKASLPYLFQRLNGLHRSAVTPTTISLPLVVANLGLLGALLAVKLTVKSAAVYPLARRYAAPHATFTTLLMSTGLTFGTISATYGFTAGLIDRAQFSVLVTVVVISAVLPTAVAQRFFAPDTARETQPDETTAGRPDLDLEPES
jgi:hypothetical protein